MADAAHWNYLNFNRIDGHGPAGLRVDPMVCNHPQAQAARSTDLPHLNEFGVPSGLGNIPLRSHEVVAFRR